MQMETSRLHSRKRNAPSKTWISVQPPEVTWFFWNRRRLEGLLRPKEAKLERRTSLTWERAPVRWLHHEMRRHDLHAVLIENVLNVTVKLRKHDWPLFRPLQ